ncbi:MAG: hypothetical protein AAF089_02270 [Bacteroidota bacterium]
MPDLRKSRSRQRRPVSVYADLDLDLAGDAVTVRSTPEKVLVDVADAPAALRIARTLQGSGGAALFERLPPAFDVTGINAEIRVAGRPVARIGPAFAANLVGRLVADGVAVYPWSFVKAWLRGS